MGSRNVTESGRGRGRLAGPWCMLLALAGAAAACEPQTFVLVTFEMPEGLEYDGIRVVIDAGDGPGQPQVYPLKRRRAPQDRDPNLDIGVPRDGRAVKVRAQATLDTFVVAEGERNRIVASDQAAGVVIRMMPCPSIALASDSGCTGVNGNDAGASEVADAGADGDGPGESVGTSPDSATCVDPADPQESPSILPTPSNVPAGCVPYCKAMNTKCPLVYLTEERCLYACATLDWPGHRDPDDGLVCRRGYAERVSLTDREQQDDCYRASPDSHGACSEPCVQYCGMGQLLCPTAFPPGIECLKGCTRLAAELPLKVPPRTIEQELACRLIHLQQAIFNRKVCSWAGPNHCGDCPYPLDFSAPPP
jgi:hypothetical protein